MFIDQIKLPLISSDLKSWQVKICKELIVQIESKLN